MKKKLLVLSASAILASNFIFDNSASAVVDVRENKFESNLLKIGGELSHPTYVKEYIKSLDKLIYNNSINMHAGYDEPEYKEALDEYQKKFMAEMEALNNIRQEQKLIDDHNGMYWDKTKKGLTYERYKNLYLRLLELRKEFDREAEKIEQKHVDLKRFTKEQQDNADWKMNVLENKIIMIGNTFKKDEPEAVQNMYNKLDMVISKDQFEYYQMLPTNNRMLVEKTEDLESIIDEFFKEINKARPIDIPPLSEQNMHNYYIKEKLKKDANAAKQNPKLVDPGVKIRADKLKKAEEAAKAERINKAKNAKPSQAKKLSKTKEQKTFKHKQLKKRSESNKELNIKEPSSKASVSTHVAPSTQNPQRNSKQAKQNKLNNTLPGMSGESNNFTVTHNSKPSGQSKGNSSLIEFSEDTAPKNNELNQQNQTTNAPVVKETITESNVVDIDQSSFYEKSGYKYGYSESDTSGYTERDKRAIRRNHVREAEELVNKYVNSHSYQDRIAAQAKVKTLSQEQQKRLNQQIDKIYNGQ